MKKLLLIGLAACIFGATGCAKKQVVAPEEKVEKKEEKAPEEVTKPVELPPAQPEKPALPFTEADIIGTGSDGEGIVIHNATQ